MIPILRNRFNLFKMHHWCGGISGCFQESKLSPCSSQDDKRSLRLHLDHLLPSHTLSSAPSAACSCFGYRESAGERRPLNPPGSTSHELSHDRRRRHQCLGAIFDFQISAARGGIARHIFAVCCPPVQQPHGPVSQVDRIGREQCIVDPPVELFESDPHIPLAVIESTEPQSVGRNPSPLRAFRGSIIDALLQHESRARIRC